mgnify:CR=1 FL=1
MAKKRINKEDVAPKGIFDNVIQGAEQSKQKIEMLTASIKALKEIAKTVKSDMPKGMPSDTKQLKNFDDLTRKANETAKAKLNIDKQLLKEKARLQEIQRQQNKEIRTTVQAEQKLTKEQQKSLGTLQKLELSNKKLRAERSKLNLETKKGTTRLKEINAQIDKNNAKIKNSGDAMKKQRLNVGNYTSAIGKLQNVLGKLGLAFGVFQLARTSFNVIKDFEQSQADLASVLGVTTDKMSGLTDQAKELGATTTFTASQVAELQKELAKLGFDQTEIENMTEATLMLAEATGTELGRSAEVVGATLRGFGLDSAETQRVVDVMAKSFSASSLDMEKFATSMSSVAPVAKLAGFSIEETTSLIGTLTDRGIDASTAGTGLRNMFLLSGKAGLTLDEALEKINNSSDKTATSLDLFGQRGATLGVILAENRDTSASLSEKLEMADGSARKMAETQRNTLGGAIKLLQSAFEGLILKMNEAGGVGEILRNGITFLAENLETIVSVLSTAVKVFLSYQVVVKSTALANKLGIKSFKDLGKATKGLKGTFKKLGDSLKSNIFGIIILGAYKLYEAFTLVNTASEQMESIQGRLNDVHADAQVQLQKEKDELDLLVESIKNTTNGTIDREIAINNLNDKYGTSLENIKNESEFLKQLDLQQLKIIENIEKKINLMEKEQEFAIISEELIRTEIEQTKLRNQMAEAWGQNAFTEFLQGFGDYENTRGVLQDQFKENEKLLERLDKQKSKVKKDLQDLKVEEQKSQKTVVTEADVIAPDNEKVIASEKKKLSQLEKLKNTRKKLEEQLENLVTLETKANDPELTSKKEEIKEIDVQIQKLKEIISLKGKSNKIDLSKLKKADVDSVLKPEDPTIEELEQEQELLDKKNKQKELDNLKNIEREEDFQEAELQREKDYLDQKIKLLEAYGKDATDLKIERAKLDKKIEEKIQEDLTLEAKSELEKQQEAISLATEFFSSQQDKKIAKINEEIETHKKLANTVEQLAINGNITAKESLAEQNRLIAEAEMERERTEKRKQQLLLVSSVLTAYTKNLETMDSGQAFSQAVLSNSVLEQFIGTLGSFFDGTEDTGTTTNALDSNGGRLAVLHNNERVMTAKQNKMLGNISNDEVARIIENKRLGNLVDSSQINAGWENHLLVNELINVTDKLDEVKRTIANKPEFNVEVGQLTSTAMKIVETQKKKGIKTVNTFKVKAK